MKPIALIVGALAMAVLPGVAETPANGTAWRRLHAGTRIAIDLPIKDASKVDLRAPRKRNLTYQASREITVSRADIIRVSGDRA